MRGIFLAAVFAALLVFGCQSGKLTNATGSGTQTTNGACVTVLGPRVSAYLFFQDDTTEVRDTNVNSVTLRLFNESYTPFDRTGVLDSAAAQDSATFVFKTQASGNYNLYIIHANRKSGIFIPGISLSDTGAPLVLRRYFAPLCSLFGIVSDSSHIVSSYKGVFISGSPFFTLADSAGNFHLAEIPEGSYKITADYFNASISNTFVRIKVAAGHDSLMSFADSLTVRCKGDSLLQRMEFSL